MNIIPIKELQNTAKISKMAHETNQPIFITKNGYEHLVVMSSETYKRDFIRNYVDEMLAKSEEDIKHGRLIDGETFFAQMKAKYGF